MSSKLELKQFRVLAPIGEPSKTVPASEERLGAFRYSTFPHPFAAVTVPSQRPLEGM